MGRMSTRARALLSTAIGLTLAVAGGLVFTFGVLRPHHQQQRDELLGKLVFAFSSDEVTGLTLVSGRQRVVIERVAGGQQQELPSWRLREPVEAEGDDVAINGLVGVLANLDAVRRLEPSATPDDYGLGEPRRRFEIELRDGQRQVLLLGKKNPFQGWIYAQREGGESVLVLAGHLEETLARTAFDLRRKDLVRFEPQAVRRLVLEEGERRLALERAADGWHLTEPLSDRADDEVVGRLLSVLRNLRAVRFPRASLPDSAMGLDPPAVSVRLTLGAEGLERLVRLGRGTLKVNSDAVFARSLEPAGPAAEVNEFQLKQLQLKPFELQAKSPMVFDRQRVFQIKSTTDQELLVLERNPAGEFDGVGGGWSIVSPVAATAVGHRVESWLTSLTRLKAKRFVGPVAGVDLARWGLAPPQRTITLVDRDGGELASLRLGRALPGADGRPRVFAVGSGRDQVCELEPADVEKIPKQAEDLREDPGSPGAGEAAGDKKP